VLVLVLVLFSLLLDGLQDTCFICATVCPCTAHSVLTGGKHLNNSDGLQLKSRPERTAAFLFRIRGVLA
jgi:hypothetical protein